MIIKQCLYTLLDGRYDLSDMSKLVLMLSFMLVSAVAAYLLGSLNFAIIFSKLFYQDDVRQHGSGNAGATNMLRTYGKGKAILTLACDMLKCVVAILIGSMLFGVMGADIAGLFCVLGHVFPCWYKFRGGKGVAVTAVVILMTSFPVFLILLLVFAIIVIGTRYVSLASVMVALLYPVLLSSWNSLVSDGAERDVLMAVIIAVIVVVMHRENIKRILDKTESKISFGKGKSQDKAETEADQPTTLLEDKGSYAEERQGTASYKRYKNKQKNKRHHK